MVYWTLNQPLLMTGSNHRKVFHTNVQSCYELFYYAVFLPMNTSLLIRHQFDVKSPRGKFVKVSSISKGKFTWKL